VNRAAARRALARLHRETARALSSGTLPDEEPRAPQVEPAVAPVVVRQKVVAPAPALAARADPELEPEVALETQAIRLAHEAEPVLAALPALSPELDAMLTALCVEPAELEPLEESDALTVALDVRASSEAEPAPEFDVDVDFDALESESGVAPTVMRDAPVAPIGVLAPDEPSPDLPMEACTRPEPVVLRKSRRPESDGTEFLARTPTLGSLAAQLPVLEAAQIAELSALHADEAPADVRPDEVDCSAESEAPPVVPVELVICSAPMEECTEPMPEVAPLLPGVAIVASRKSDVSELVKSFQVADDDSNPGLCRAIKEMADLDLTPAPFAALIR